jgi:alpha-galactosidase
MISELHELPLKINNHKRMKKEKTYFEMGDMSVYFVKDKDSNRLGFGFVPTESKKELVDGRPNFIGDTEIEELPEEWRPTVPRDIFSLAQVHCAGDAANEGPAGRSMLNGETSTNFKFVGQEVEETNQTKTIKTVVQAENGLQCRHNLSYNSEEKRIAVDTVYKNTSNNAITLEMASSFSMSDLSPFDADCSHDRLYLHRFKTFWSREGRHVIDSINSLQMFPSWHVAHYANEKFGQVGSWSTNGWYPQMALEDRQAGVMWGVRLAWGGSWQMELFRRDDQLNFACGLADYDFGHWRKTLQPGEELKVPKVFITTCKGDIDELSSRLLEAPYEKAKETQLPITFNDWCTNWGVPSEKSVEGLAKALKPLDCDYLIIDAGWYKPDNGLWNLAHGDWKPNKKLYPKGLKRAADIIQENGLKPGLWFEYETVGIESELFHRTDLMLHANGRPIQTGVRRFLDFRKKEVIEYLEEKVIKTLKENGFQYIKIDYNSSIGKGVDGAESLGEGLREHLLEVNKFLEKMRDEIPGLVIEDCSSGGMRLDPLTLHHCDLGSFSDAHASPEIPIIAANLHRLIHPSKSLVWAVVRPEESLQRINYSMAATFLGRLCISGEIDLLSDKQLSIVANYMILYRKINHLILDGTTRIYGNKVDNYRRAKGCQVVLRENKETGEVLLVCHSFELTASGINIELEIEGYGIVKEQVSDSILLKESAGSFRVEFVESWSGAVFYLSEE